MNDHKCDGNGGVVAECQEVEHRTPQDDCDVCGPGEDFPHTDCDDCPGCEGECQTEAPWGAQPLGDAHGQRPFDPEGTLDPVGAERVMLKMHSEEGEVVEVNLLQVVNQMFLDMGHIHMRLLAIEQAAGLAPPEEEAAEESLILMPDSDIEV